MKSESERNSVRKYLLGKLDSEAEMRQFEEKILLDDEFAESLAVAEDELIEEYLEGALTAEEAQNFDTHFLISKERRQKLNLTRNLQKYAARVESEKPAEIKQEKSKFFDWRGLFALPAVRFAAIALLAVGVGFAVWRAAFYESDVDKGLAQLRQAYRGQRPIEPRTSADFDYAPMPNTRGASTAAADEKARARAERYLLDATEDTSNAAAHHALGLFYLAERRPDQAVNEFNAALKLNPDAPKLLADLGAAYLEKVKQAEIEENGEEFFQNANAALQNLNRALELNPNLLEALFNRALLLQKMRLTNQAREAWQKYLEKDSTSGWADEARRNLELLNRQSAAPKTKEQILQDFLEAFRRRDDARAWEIVSQTKEFVTGIMIQQQLARKFLELEQDKSRKEEQNEVLSAFVYLGGLERHNVKDPYFAELASFYANTNREQREKLIKAHDELKRGQELILKSNFKQALEILQSAKDLFFSAQNIWEVQLVEYQICYCLCQIDRINESQQRLIALSNICEEKSYFWMQALADGWIGSNYGILGERSKALSYNLKSLTIAEKSDDVYNIQRALVQTAEEYRLIGDTQKTLNSIFRSLRLPISYNFFPRQKSRDLIFATDSLYSSQFYEAALVFGQEEVHVARNEVKSNWMSHTAYRNLGKIYGRLQRYEESLRQIESALQISASFADEAMQKSLKAQSLVARGQLHGQMGEWHEALNDYNEAIEIYNKMEFSVGSYEARKGRLLVYIAQKNDSAVREEMPALLQLFDQNRQRIVEESSRNIFFDAEQGIYDIATDYVYTQLRDAEQSFNYAENSRARSLLDLIQRDASKPLLLSEIRPKMPADVQMIYYAALKDKILIWRISDKDVHSTEKSIRYNELDDKIQSFLKLLTRRAAAEETEHAAKDLYQLLIEPIEPKLEPDKILCIVGDKILFRVPFAALVSPHTKKYLVEDYQLLFAPSATVFVNQTEIAGEKPSARDETILSVGNPSFSRREYPELPDLPSAAREAREISALYGSAKLFIGSDAVKQRVAKNLKEVDVIHFAGHYVPNSKSPSLSKLLLTNDAGSTEEDKDLTVREIVQSKLPQARLIILSACETGVEKFYQGEGMIGAARAFLASDVPLVVASQWSVDSDATAELMIKLHRLRKEQRLTTTAALRQAQLDLIRNDKSRFQRPFYWAGFLSIGGYADY